MNSFLKRIKADYLFSSLVGIALGVIFIIWKTRVLEVMGSVIAIALIVFGLVFIALHLFNVSSNIFSAIMGAVVLIIGIWFLINPTIIVTIVPILIGGVMVFHGIRGLVETFRAKGFGYKAWGINLALSIIGIVFGIICITNAFGIMQKAITVAGVILIVNGLFNIWIATRSTKAERIYNKNNPIDVDFVDAKEVETVDFIEDSKEE